MLALSGLDYIEYQDMANVEYVSTRATGEEDPKGYSDVLLAGLAPDNGLYTPKEYPHLSLDDIKSLQYLTYEELYVKIKSLFIGGSFSLDEQKRFAAQAFGIKNFLMLLMAI